MMINDVLYSINLLLFRNKITRSSIHRVNNGIKDLSVHITLYYAGI